MSKPEKGRIEMKNQEIGEHVFQAHQHIKKVAEFLLTTDKKAYDQWALLGTLSKLEDLYEALTEEEFGLREHRAGQQGNGQEDTE